MTSGHETEADGPREDARAERVERRRRQVLEAATGIMSRTGYHRMSMQAVADAAGMSVGLIYQYFSNKEEVLTAVIVDILNGFTDRVPAAMDGANGGPEARLARGFEAYCRVIDERRAATLLAYRESQTLPKEGRRALMELERRTSEPLSAAVAAGIESGVFRPVDPDLVAHDLKMAAQSWALKQWDVGRRFRLEDYVDAQLDLVLAGIRARP